jgi:hypothetical protein
MKPTRPNSLETSSISLSADLLTATSSKLNPILRSQTQPVVRWEIERMIEKWTHGTQEKETTLLLTIVLMLNTCNFLPKALTQLEVRWEIERTIEKWTHGTPEKETMLLPTIVLTLNMFNFLPKTLTQLEQRWEREKTIEKWMHGTPEKETMLMPITARMPPTFKLRRAAKRQKLSWPTPPSKFKLIWKKKKLKNSLNPWPWPKTTKTVSHSTSKSKKNE